MTPTSSLTPGTLRAITTTVASERRTPGSAPGFVPGSGRQVVRAAMPGSARGTAHRSSLRVVAGAAEGTIQRIAPPVTGATTKGIVPGVEPAITGRITGPKGRAVAQRVAPGAARRASQGGSPWATRGLAGGLARG